MCKCESANTHSKTQSTFLQNPPKKNAAPQSDAASGKTKLRLFDFNHLYWLFLRLI